MGLGAEAIIVAYSKGDDQNLQFYIYNLSNIMIILLLMANRTRTILVA